jgi:hypothetical protein
MRTGQGTMNVPDVPTTIDLTFGGYWREPNVSGLPAGAGIYCVYTCTYNNDAQPKPTVSIAKLVYIGESSGILERVTNHPLWDEWKKQLAARQVVCVSASTVNPEATRQRAEAALIFKHKPPMNNEYTHSFPFDTTTVHAGGKTERLTVNFTVKKDAND